MTAPPPVRAPADPSGADAPARPAPSARLSLAAAAWSAALGFVLAVAAASLARAGAPLAGVALAAAAAAGAAGWLWVRRRVERPLSRVATAVGADGPGRVLESLADRASELGERLRAGEAQRARTEKMATVGRMAAGIAHEVGNPLAAINGYAHVLRSRSADRPDLSPVLDALERESARIDRIVRGLLEYARPRRITPASVDVNEVLGGVLGLLRDQGVLRRLELRAAFADPAPTVFAERYELEQVFVNLLLNAADAMDGGPGVLAVVTREVAVDRLGQGGRRAGDASDVLVPPRPNRRVTEWLSGAGRAPRAVAQIVVADSGPGIAPADWERVFDPFYTTKDVGRGTGLGLALVARAVDQLGGAVWVQRAREGGAAFVILLPLASAAAPVEAPPSFEEQLDFLRSMAR